VKNFLTVTLLSIGMPMVLMGDEVRRTQRGNNNAYCHDNEISWFDWSLVEKHADILRFASLLIERRRLRAAEYEKQGLTLNQMLRKAKCSWHGVKIHTPDWSGHSHSVAFTAELQKENMLLHLILNAYWEPLEFELPPLDNGGMWRRWIDTAIDSPHDIVPWQESPTISGSLYRAEPRSVVVLFAGVK
jgi:glycogen operon protein